MSPLELHTQSGIHVLPESFLLVGIDETGHESPSRSNHPVFGLGGCAVPVSLYRTLVREPWISLKEAHFGGRQSPLHANELRDPSPIQVAALAEFFRSHGFGRIAVTVSTRTVCIPALPAYQLASRGVLERIARLVGRFGCDGAALVVEESTRGDVLAGSYFEGYHLELRCDEETVKLPLLKFRMSKSHIEPILEVSDFIVHTAGGQVRSAHRGIAWGARRDFDVVFRSIDPSLAEFMDITEARFNSPAPNPRTQL